MVDLAATTRLNLLIELLTDFTSVSNVDRLVASLSARAPFLVPFGRCLLFLGHDIASPSRVAVVRQKHVPASEGARELSALESSLAARAFSTTLPAVDDLRRPRVACYPLASDGQLLGMLILTADGVPYSMSDLRTVQVLADACASVVARIENRVVLQRMADERGTALENEKQAHAIAESANRTKDEFLATLSHELRTPLNAILGWVQTLQEAVNPDDRMARGLAAIARSAHHQWRLVEELLDMSRIIAGQLRLETAAADLRAIVADVLTAIGPAAEAKRLVIESTLDEELVICGDAARLQQVLSNLISNAVKFTPPGGTLRVAATRTHESISVHVSDTGVGIAPALLPYVFDRFRQGDGSLSRVHGGLGLGLSIVRSIVELHGGTVLAASPGVDQGTTVTITLPASPSVRQGDPARTAESGGHRHR